MRKYLNVFHQCFLQYNKLTFSLSLRLDKQVIMAKDYILCINLFLIVS